MIEKKNEICDFINKYINADTMNSQQPDFKDLKIEIILNRIKTIIYINCNYMDTIELGKIEQIFIARNLHTFILNNQGNKIFVTEETIRI